MSLIPTVYKRIGTGAAKIGRTGEKLHRASKMFSEFADGTTKETWVVTCSCGCTGLKSARGHIEFFPDKTPNCGK